jgi:hypothetical protein
MDMVRTLTMRGHTVFLDRGFTSPALVRWLGSRGHGGTGTVVPNRKGFPKDLKLHKDAPKGSVDAAVTVIGKMLAICWKDKKPVYFLTNCHTMTIGSTQRREGAAVVDVDCPEVALAYNNHKDAVDQYDKSCLTDNKSLEQSLSGWKWWHRLWWGLFDGAVVNAYIIWQHYHKDATSTRTEFMLQLQEEMIENRLDGRVAVTRRMAEGEGEEQVSRRLDGVNHFVKRHPLGLSRSCKMCAFRASGTSVRPPRVITFCLKCSAHLCNDGDCIEAFHTHQDPKLDRKAKTTLRKKKNQPVAV